MASQGVEDVQRQEHAATLLDNGSGQPTCADASVLAAAGPSRARGTADPVGDDGDVNLDPENTAMLNLFCAWSIGFLAAVEGTVSVPSLWKYVESLGGTRRDYGMAISIFAIGRVAAMGMFGMWVDRRTYKEVYVVSLLISMFSGFLYASAPTVGLWALLVGRGLLGAMSAQTVATQAFISRNTSLRDRTRYMSINVLVSNTLTLGGPAFNFIIVALPEFEVELGQRRMVFNRYTWVGYFLLCGQLAVLAFIVCCFKEPHKGPFRRPHPMSCAASVLTLGGLFPWMRVWIDPWLRKTGCWFIFVNNFRNNFTAFSVTYAVPLITDRDYGWGQLQNSYIFLGLAIESIISTAVVGYASKWTNDRNLLTLWGIIAHSGLLAYALISGFGSNMISLALLLSLLIWYDFGTSAPATQALYSKLIGKGNAGLYFAMLQSNGAVSRVLSGQIVGFAYNSWGAPALWGCVHLLWALSWIALCVMWKRLHPEYIKAMHARLGSPEVANTS